jgi:hypothetical protein
MDIIRKLEPALFYKHACGLRFEIGPPEIGALKPDRSLNPPLLRRGSPQGDYSFRKRILERSRRDSGAAAVFIRTKEDPTDASSARLGFKSGDDGYPVFKAAGCRSAQSPEA